MFVFNELEMTEPIRPIFFVELNDLRTWHGMVFIDRVKFKKIASLNSYFKCL